MRLTSKSAPASGRSAFIQAFADVLFAFPLGFPSGRLTFMKVIMSECIWPLFRLSQMSFAFRPTFPVAFWFHESHCRSTSGPSAFI